MTTLTEAFAELSTSNPPWEGTATELLAYLEENRNLSDLPRNPTQLSIRMNAMGIERTPLKGLGAARRRFRLESSPPPVVGTPTVELAPALPTKDFFFQGCQVRTRGTWDNPLFCAGDVCRILGLADTGQALERIDPETIAVDRCSGAENGSHRISYDGPDANVFITEKGLYELMVTSRKPVAGSFRKWIFGEVVPSLRKTGSYSMNGSGSLSTQAIIRSMELNLEAIRSMDQRIEVVETGLSETKHLAEITDLTQRTSMSIIQEQRDVINRQNRYLDKKEDEELARAISGSDQFSGICQQQGRLMSKETKDKGKAFSQAYTLVYEQARRRYGWPIPLGKGGKAWAVKNHKIWMLAKLAREMYKDAAGIYDMSLVYQDSWQ